MIIFDNDVVSGPAHRSLALPWLGWLERISLSNYSTNYYQSSTWKIIQSAKNFSLLHFENVDVAEVCPTSA